MLYDDFFLASLVSFSPMPGRLVLSAHTVARSCLRQTLSGVWCLQSAGVIMNFGEQQLIIAFNLSGCSSLLLTAHISVTAFSNHDIWRATYPLDHRATPCFRIDVLRHGNWAMHKMSPNTALATRQIYKGGKGRETKYWAVNIWEQKEVTGHVDELIHCHSLWRWKIGYYH